MSDYRKKIEPDAFAFHSSNAITQLSIAISLKRIADALEKQPDKMDRLIKLIEVRG